MIFERVKKIADAMLYQGYVLYPDRGATIKCPKRCTSGTLYPAGNSFGKPDQMQVQCLVVGEAAKISIAARFLHLLNRDIFKLDSPADTLPQDWQQQATPVASIQIGETVYQTSQEAVQREIRPSTRSLQAMVGNAQHDAFSFSLASDVEPIEDDGRCVAVVQRSQSSVTGDVEIMGEVIGDHVFKLTLTLRNTTHRSELPASRREGRLEQVFASAHLILGVEEGHFVSTIDPPPEWATLAATCQNRGLWPVLAGDPPDQHYMLATPVILHDYPQINSPQIASQGSADCFDETDIDEMLAMRVMTMTDQEIKELQSTDEPAWQILQRTESNSLERRKALHRSSKVN
ncbi:hypothetical protein [Novipirellula sp.]|uniref:hypothetical protein n=1 Tax=Novipirellula sp. TaxID=2795430 RepID=UPI003567A363